MLMVPVSLGLLVTAPLLVPVLLGDQWLADDSGVANLLRLWPDATDFDKLVASVFGRRQAQYMFYRFPGGHRGDGAVGRPADRAVWHSWRGNRCRGCLHRGDVLQDDQAERLLPGSARKTLFQSLPFLLAGGLMSAAILLAWDVVIALTGDENALALILLIALGALTDLAVVLVVQRPLIVELYELTISPGSDRRWPRLAARRPRPTE